MVLHREVPRTAAFAWSPGAATPLIATGTRAGAVDADFSSETQLELWDLELDRAAPPKELKPVAQIGTDSRFHDIAWVQPKEGHKRGIIAGGLENGALDLWDAAALLAKQDAALLSRTTKHTGAIKALQFNPFRPELLATAGAKGELYIWDTNNIANPFRLGTNAGRADDYECLDWNKQVPHIMVTGGSGGFVTVWDVRSKKESLTLNNNGRKAVSAVAWDPEKSTRLITAVPLDSDPLILAWDLRNSNAPEKIMRGHEGGVLSLSWCRADHDLLLSCGKDNRTTCWNPQTGEPYGDFPIVTNWTFQTKWNPHNPSILATASFDGKIAIRSIQNTKREATTNEGDRSLEGADFFDKASAQPQTSSFSLAKAPKWLERPNGASFGFGGKLVSISQVMADGKPTGKSVVHISNFSVDDDISGITEAFAKTMKEGDLKAICKSHIDDSKNETEKEDWKVIETLLDPSPRRALVRYLGVAEEDPASEANGEAVDAPKKAATDDDDADFFDKNVSEEDLLPRLASTKGVKSNTPFQLHTESDSEADKDITRALTQGQFVKAMEICLKEDRLSDALMIAMCGGDAAKEKVQAAYFKKQSSGPNYVRLLASIIGKNLWDVVHNANLSNWKDVMASLTTFSRGDEFQELCEALGDRLEEQSQSDSSKKEELRQSASFCYIAGSNLEKVVGLWISDLQRNEEASLKSATSGSSFSIHAAALQSFIEKVTVFRAAVNYEDAGSTSEKESKLAPLYERYIEYADIVSAHGQLQVAEEYLKLLPKSYQTAASARERVQQATKTAAPAPRAPAQPAHGYMPPTPAQPSMGPISPQHQYGANAYAPNAQQQPPAFYRQAQPYAPPAPYGQAQAPNMYQPLQQQPPQPLGPPPSGPPRNMSASPSIAPPSQDRKIANWNDTPDDFFKAPTPRGTPRRGTPTVPAAAPNPYAPQGLSGGMGYSQQSPKAAEPPPPPKGMAPPPRTSGTPIQSFPERPPSTTNPYAPPPAAAQPPQVVQAMAPPPRGPSPYNQPPQSGAAPGGGSRYAPAPAPAPAQAAPPPGAVRSPPPNPYAPSPSMAAPPSAASGPPPMGGPPAQAPPPMGGPPPSGPPRQAPPAAAPPAAASAHPPGDRSHIPSEAKPIYELLSADMARVKAKAPASFKDHVKDTEKRLGILFDHLNNGTLLTPPTIGEMAQLAEAVAAKEYDKAMQLHMSILKTRNEECTNWMTGVKRLISMSRATP